MLLRPVLTAWAPNLITTPLSNCRSEGTPVSCRFLRSLLHPRLAGGPTAELGHVSHHPFPVGLLPEDRPGSSGLLSKAGLTPGSCLTSVTCTPFLTDNYWSYLVGIYIKVN